MLRYFLTWIVIVFGLNLCKTQDLDAYKLWMRYRAVENHLVEDYGRAFQGIYSPNDNETHAVLRSELEMALEGMLGMETVNYTPLKSASIIIEKIDRLPDYIREEIDLKRLHSQESFLIESVKTIGKDFFVLTSQTDMGLLYATYRLLFYMQSGQKIQEIDLKDGPQIDLRVLNHWDNLDRTVERGYAGNSIWKWHKLPGYIDRRYIDYARANASIGINGTVLTNVNANATVLTSHYIAKVAALAAVFRPYGIKVYLTARFSAPIEIGGLATADPLDLEVQQWWSDKTKEIYDQIPDFGGFLVKANSEGQPGPQDYDRNHVDGANMLAHAMRPFGGVVIWRAFVYSEHNQLDRAGQAFAEFVPYDGQFEKNVLIQVKNGPIDFQPREPFHPMFGAMPNTPLMMEFQITQEYLGFSSHLAFLPTLYEEVLQSETYQEGKGSKVSTIIDGSLDDSKLSGMAGVSNIGSDLNWTGHPVGQANWYGFGRLAWNPNLKATTIADEWIGLTYSNDQYVKNTIKSILLNSREAVVNYMNPYGLHHLFDTGHHYGPGPWVSNLSRPEWNPTYYHNADSLGIGFDRTTTGSNTLSQYAPELEALFTDLESCPEEFLLWFHHLPWDYQLNNGLTLWEGLTTKYQEGVDQVKLMIRAWKELEGRLTESDYNEVLQLLRIQLNEAIWWKDASILYFQSHSKRPFPKSIDKPLYSLDYYQSLKFPFAPGIRPHWD